ncbi:hypothetical protein M3Y97_00650100 [Aphelenchoides bicaudatus]|nr:hypothetical protein M3Y97_00650100 [Aphelenchoides bicaudatus]
MPFLPGTGEDEEDCEVVYFAEKKSGLGARQDLTIKQERKTPADIRSDKLRDELRAQLMNMESHWLRKSTLLTAEIKGKIPLPQLKLLELELAIYFRKADDIAASISYLYENYKYDETFKAKAEQLNNMIKDNKGNAFANELVAKIEPIILLEPALASAMSPFEKLRALMTVVKAIGFAKIFKKIYAAYSEARISEVDDASTKFTGYDIIWFHMREISFDEKLYGLSSDQVFVIYQAMLNLCLADAHGELDEKFYEISDSFGLPRLSPKDNWKLPLKVLSEALYSRNEKDLSETIASLKIHFNIMSFLKVSELLVETLQPQDDEIAKFLLSYAIGMKRFYEGDSHVVFMPAKIFDVSKRSIKNYWTHNTQQKTEYSSEEIDYKFMLESNADQYLELLAITRNVYAAYKNLNPNLKSEFLPQLRDLLQKIQLPNPYSLIAQSFLVSGQFEQATTFIPLAIRTTKHTSEQTLLMVQLLEANAAMRQTKTVMTYALEFLNDKDVAKKSVEEATGVLLNRRFEDDSFVQIPVDSIYHYVALLFMNSAVIAFTRRKKEENALLTNFAATIVVLCAQCCWPFCVEMMQEVLELMDRDLTIVNAIDMITNSVLFAKLLNTQVNFMEGSEVLKRADVLAKYRNKRDNKEVTRYTPFQNLALYIKAHDKSVHGTTLMQKLFS